jgi:hypothetical protein
VIAQVSAGGFMPCAVLVAGGGVVCWGAGYHAPAIPAGLTGVTQVSAGSVGALFACALANGTVTCWGDNYSGETSVPAGLTNVTQVSAGGEHVCALANGAITCWGYDNWRQTTVPAPPSGHVLPTATFSATPLTVAAGGSFTLALSNAQVPGHSEATTFTYTFDCGDGAGYAAASSTPNATCATTTAGPRSVKGKVADQDGDAAEYSATVTVAATVAQAITFTSTPPSPALVGGTYAVSAQGGASGNPVTFGSRTPTTCSVSGATVTFVATGSCIVAADQAGNTTYTAAPQATQTIAVVYAFAGFFSPVNNLPMVNTVKAGSAIPVKFSLGGNRGLAILAAGSPTSQVVACQSGAATDPVEQTVTAGASALSYDAPTGQYTYVWKTDNTWTNSCRTLTVTLADGTSHAATFQFTK